LPATKRSAAAPFDQRSSSAEGATSSEAGQEARKNEPLREEPSPGTALEETQGARYGRVAQEMTRVEKLRVMHVVNYLRRGGMEFNILKVIEKLGAANFDHRFCTTRRYDDDFVRLYGLQNRLDVAAGSAEGLQFPLFRLMKIFRRYRPHIVHTHNWGALEAVPAARLAGVRTIIHSEHGYEVETLGGAPMRQRLFRKWAYSMTDAMFAVSRDLREHHARLAWIGAERIRVIYNGVDTNRFCPALERRAQVRRELGISEKTYVVGSVGRLVPIKDYETLISAASRLCAQGIDIVALLVGTGPELASLQEHVNSISNLEGRVHFLGACDRVPEVLNSMDTFVLPSLGEGMSNTLLEAMASGLPVVATNVGGNPEVVGSRGSRWLFGPRDVATLAELLVRLAKNPEERHAEGTAARERAMHRFSLQVMAEQYRNLYLEATAQCGIRVCEH